MSVQKSKFFSLISPRSYDCFLLQSPESWLPLRRRFRKHFLDCYGRHHGAALLPTPSLLSPALSTAISELVFINRTLRSVSGLLHSGKHRCLTVFLKFPHGKRILLPHYTFSLLNISQKFLQSITSFIMSKYVESSQKLGCK